MSEVVISTREELELRKLSAEAEEVELRVRKLNLEIASLSRQDAGAVSHAYQNRTYTFYDKVGSESVKTCMETLGVWHRRDPGQPIRVIFNSPGGTVMDGLALFDYLQELRGAGHFIETVALGMAASMGGVLLQAGDIRAMGRSAFMLIHEASAGAVGKVSELEDSVEFSKMLQERLLTILSERSTMTIAQIKRRWARRDWWLTATEAKTLGFADDVR